jgi:hypothetical protein
VLDASETTSPVDEYTSVDPEKINHYLLQMNDILLGVNAEVSTRLGSGVPTPTVATFPPRVLRFARKPSVP